MSKTPINADDVAVIEKNKQEKQECNGLAPGHYRGLAPLDDKGYACEVDWPDGFWKSNMLEQSKGCR